MGSNPYAITFDGAYMWTMNYLGNTVNKVDVQTGLTVATTTVGSGPLAAAFDGRYLWVANRDSLTVSKIDTFTNAVVRTYAVDSNPYSVVYDGASVWVAIWGSAKVVKFPAGGSDVGADSTLHANLVPDLNNTWNLGSASTSWANIYASGTIAGANLLFTNATGVSLSVTNYTASTFNTTNITWTSATGTNTTSTNLYASNLLFNGATGSNINVTGIIATTGTINTIGFVNATGSNLYVSGLIQTGTIMPIANNTYNLGSASTAWANVYASGTGSTFFGITWTYATGTNTTSTNLYATYLLFNGATGSNIYLSGGERAVSSTINNINFINATGSQLSFTNATGSNLYISGLLQTGTILPIANNTYDLGSASTSWRNIYASGTIAGANMLWTNATGTNLYVTNFTAGLFTTTGITWTNATGTNTTSTNLFATTLLFTNATGTAIYAPTIRATTFCLTGDTCITSWPVGVVGGVGSLAQVVNTGNTATTTPYFYGGLWASNVMATGTLYASSSVMTDAIWTSATGTSLNVESVLTVGAMAAGEELVTSTGGTITSDGTYWIHTFTASGNFTPNGAVSVDALVVGGGGAGGSDVNSGWGGGGGGGGGVVYTAGHAVTAQPYSVVVGPGGTPNLTKDDVGGNGTTSTFDTISAMGGGGGGNTNRANGAHGGSGGGGAATNEAPQGSGGTGIPGQGNAGADGSWNVNDWGGAGGGASSSGSGMSGGVGASFSISGASTTYGGGGGGATDGSAGGGGFGGGGNGSNSGVGADGTVNRGGGGGASGHDSEPSLGGSGGSGVVIVRYLKSATANASTFGFSAYANGNVSASGTVTVAQDVVVGGSSVCLENGTNCPTSFSGLTLQNPTVQGNITNTLVATTTLAYVGGVASGGFPHQPFVVGKYAYLVSQEDNLLEVIDVSDPTAPAIVGSVPLNYYASSIYVSGRYAYVTVRQAGIFNIIDVSDAAHPVIIATSTVGTSDSMSVTVQGRYAYLSGIDGNPSVYVMDVADPYHPKVVSSFHPNSACSVTPAGRFLYVGSWGRFTIGDISDPTHPSQVGESAYNGSRDYCYVAVQGRYAYVDSYSDGTITVFDVSSSTNPTVVTTLDQGGPTRGDDGTVVVSGRYLYASDYTDQNFHVYDVTDPTSPVLVASTTAAHVVSDYGPRGIAVSGQYMYAAEMGYGLTIYKIPGIETSALLAHSAELGSLNVTTNGTIAGNLNVGGGLGVGPGGILTNGDLGVYGTSTFRDINASGTVEDHGRTSW